jgi:DNA-binding transcriptional ArsR family regulator
LAQVPPSDGATGEDPAAWLRWFTAAMTDYWEAVMQPHWGKMRAALREDVLSRAHLLATEGTDSLLSHLAGRTRWRDSTLELSGSFASAELRCDVGLVVVPLIFGRWMVRCVSDAAGVVAVSCQARGAAVLGEPGVSPRPPTEPVRCDRLALILGRGRAAVLRGLTVPTTTSDLSRSLGLSASTVSQHLSALTAANVVRKRRAGTRVLYTLDRAGVALLTYLDNEMGRPAV